jgi:hypothetical protein
LPKRTTYDWFVVSLTDEDENEDIFFHETLEEVARWHWHGLLQGRCRLGLRKSIEYTAGPDGVFHGDDHWVQTHADENGVLDTHFDDGSTVPKAKRAEAARFLSR